jgi:hypothetical protein
MLSQLSVYKANFLTVQKDMKTIDAGGKQSKQKGTTTLIAQLEA